MAVTLTPLQIQTTQVISAINYVNAALSGNINITPPEGQRAPQVNLTAVYVNLYNTLFTNPNGTSATSVSILATNAAFVFAFLASLYSLLTASGVTTITVSGNSVALPTLPAYTANTDGTVTLS